MYDLTAAALIFGVAHVAIMYAGIYVWNLEYKQLLLLTVIVAIATSIVARAALPTWRAEFEKERTAGYVGSDLLGMVGVLVVAGIISNTLVTRRFGLTGWLGMFGVNAILNAVI